jgi:hypothetical protein
MILRAFNSDMTRVIQRAEGTNDVDASTTYNPYFGFRYEFRLPRYDPSTIVTITFETIDKTSGQVCFLGFAFFPLFLDVHSKEPISKPSTS